MKKIILTALTAVIIAVNLYCQDLINPPALDIVRNNTTIINRGSLGFVRGWNWGSQTSYPQNQSFDSMNKGLISGAGKYY